jgi:15-cis-phytoene desaturase
MNDADVIIVGAGLAGLSCGFELVQSGKKVLLLEARPVVGGRTASWIEEGMPVESGLHRFLGVYEALPELMKRAGIDLDETIYWEDAFEIRSPERPSGVFAVAPIHKPFSTLAGLTGNWNMLSLYDKASLANFVNAGLAMYFLLPEGLDRISTLDFAKKWRVGKKAIQNILIPFTAGIFFLPPERYSAFNFCGLFGAHLNRLHKSRLGAFMEGAVVSGKLAAEIVRTDLE